MAFLKKFWLHDFLGCVDEHFRISGMQEELRFLEKLRCRQCRSRIHHCYINLSNPVTAGGPVTGAAFSFFGLVRDINDQYPAETPLNPEIMSVILEDQKLLLFNCLGDMPPGPSVWLRPFFRL
jgi:hypothetical protein